MEDVVNELSDILVAGRSGEFVGKVAAGSNLTSLCPNPGLRVRPPASADPSAVRPPWQTIPLPLSDEHPEVVARLKECCVRSTFGRGDAVVHDESYRAGWEMDSDQFALATHWLNFMKTVLTKVRTGLGLPSTFQYTAKPFKLLLYEKGDFFKTHRDTEKNTGMFASLVITLPSVHRGGRLVVRHQGECFGFGGEGDASLVRFSAFYCDCEHELEPLTSGYRLALVYNLVASSGPNSAAPSADSLTAGIRSLETQLRTWTTSYPCKAVALQTNHQYSKESIRGSLKGQDASFAAMLSGVAKRLFSEQANPLVLDSGLCLRDAFASGMGDTYHFDNVEWEDWEFKYLVRNITNPGGKANVAKRLLQLCKDDTLWSAPDDMFESQGEEEPEEVEPAMGNYPATYEKKYSVAFFVIARPYPPKQETDTENLPA
eukprot:CAMPEP_0119158182 /NCGR_PEP_ID=MMETSP1310-20130426/53134_1 /TAXON_ID=464262 /ORGANISM="Genus nov. species nov., Strain RCC2339" /LENGTH=429 /DNA_ID=CAMNT_0007150807 /DNA_START=175 /DNA_END=1460 /DNA_ORIENTATION=+